MMLLLKDGADVPLVQQTSNQRVLNLILTEVPVEALWGVDDRLLIELSRHYQNFSQVYVPHLMNQVAKCEAAIASEYNRTAGMSI